MKSDLKLNDSKAIAETKVSNVGRPPLAEEEKADKKIVIYLTQGEKETLQARAKEEGIKLPAYIKTLLNI